MANLVSPGIKVTVIDESAYASAGPGTVPFILIATEQDKLNAAGDGIALSTTKAQAGKLKLITSQRELVQEFGVPNFNNFGGSSQHGNELNEYGLLAAYSYLGNANRAYVMRADIDLGQLQPLDVAPTGDPQVGTYWLSGNTSNFAIYLHNGTDWQPHQPVVITDHSLISGSGAPNNETVPGGINGDVVGDFAVVVGVYTNGPNTYENKYYRWDGADWQPAAIFPSPTLVQGVYPVGQSAGAAWINTRELSLDLRVFVSDFVDAPAPLFADDATASAFYGSELVKGALYTRIDSVNKQFLIREYNGTAWQTLNYSFTIDAPSAAPADGTLWYSNNIQVDMLINNGVGSWITFPGTLSVQPSQPTGATEDDLWVDTDQLDEYPVIYRFKSGAWVKVNNTDQTTPNGIVFADARPTNSGALDADAPDALFYPQGMLLWNTRYSTMNVKQYFSNYEFEGVAIGPRWVSVSGNNLDGSLRTGRHAQRQMVIEALAGAISSSDELRAESFTFNLIATPGYPELIDEMVALNVDRKETAFVIGDTPLRLAPSGTSIQSWATNANGAAGNGEDGLITADPYVGVYYPSCLTTNLDGEAVVQPASHIVLRTMAYNDQVAYQWFAPAGLQRGRVSNAESVGYINSESEYVPVELNNGQRDVLYTNNINPIAFIPGQGLVVYGQKTRSGLATAMDRINVARLVNYIRYQADIIARPFLFEPNDSLTRDNARDVFDRFLSELVTLRGIYDYVVVVDESNNTPARIDRNELWIDLAIQPVKSIEFINIPIRIQNTGEF